MSEAPFYQHHIFICSNQKENGKGCGHKVSASELAVYMREQLKAKGMHGPKLCRITESRCLGRCKLGPSLVIYPEGQWYRYESKADLDLIIEQHLIKGEVVPALKMSLPVASST